MKTIRIIIFLSFLFSSIFAQQRFIKTNVRTDFGSTIRILPTPDNGWVVISLDSLKFTRFNSCGITQWSKKYLIPNDHVLLADAIKSRLGGFLLLTRITNGILPACLVTRIDDSGNILWSKSYDDNYYDQYAYTISEDNIGNIFILNNLSHTNGPYFNMICKLNSNGNIIWIKLYEFMVATWGGAITTSDNGILLRTGNVISKLDNNGNIEWSYHFSTPSTYYYYEPIEVSDGYIFTKTNTSSGNFNFYKIDKLGNLLSGGIKSSDFKGTRPILKKKSNGNIAGVFNPVIAGSSYPTIVEMDKNLNIIYQGTINHGNSINLTAEDICFNNQEEAILAGAAGNSNFFFAKLDDLYKTTCDTNLPRMQMQPETASRFSVTSNVINFNLIETTHTFNSINFIDSQISTCTVPLTIDIGDDTVICQSTTLTLRNNLFGLFDEYLWSTGQTTPFIQVNQSGDYWVKAKHICEDSIISDTIHVVVDDALKLELGPDQIECENNIVTLKSQSCSPCLYEWNTGSTGDSLVVTMKGHYWLRVEKDNGCFSNDTVEVDFLKCECDFYLPNTFTPNSDGINEIFKPVYNCVIRDYNLKIYNRWDQLIYNSKDIEEGWNGTFKNVNVVEGIYNYILMYCPVIKGLKDHAVIRSGRVSVLY